MASSQEKTTLASAQEVEMMKKSHSAKQFERFIYISDMWVTKPRLFKRFGRVPDKSAVGVGKTTPVLASAQLINVVVKNKRYQTPGTLGEHNGINALNALLRSCFQESHLMFTGLWTPESILFSADHVLDKAFVRAVMAASRWLGQERFPQGIYEWPPKQPAGFQTI